MVRFVHACLVGTCLFALAHPVFAVRTVGVDYFITNTTKEKLTITLDAVNSEPRPESDSINRDALKTVTLAPGEKKKLGRVEYFYDYTKENVDLAFTVNKEPRPVQCKFALDVGVVTGLIHVATVRSVINQGVNNWDKYACDVDTKEAFYSVLGNRPKEYWGNDQAYVDLQVVLRAPMEDLVPVCEKNVVVDARGTRHDVSIPDTICPGGTLTLRLLANKPYYSLAVLFDKPVNAKKDGVNLGVSVSPDIVGWTLQNSTCTYAQAPCKISIGSSKHNIQTGAEATVVFTNNTGEDIKASAFTSTAP